MTRVLQRRTLGATCLVGVLWCALAAAGAFARSPEDPAAGSLPRPVAQFMQRSGDCQHFAGEFGGDGSPRDAEVNRRMDTLRCNALATDLGKLRQRYRTDAQVIAQLAAYDADGMPRDPGDGD